MRRSLIIGSALSALLFAAADQAIPMGNLGFPLGKYLTIEGTRASQGKSNVDLLVETVNGKKARAGLSIRIDNVFPLPKGDRCVLRGYESGRMSGTPPEVEKQEKLQPTQQAWGFERYFVVTSVVKPEELKNNIRELHGRTNK